MLALIEAAIAIAISIISFVSEVAFRCWSGPTIKAVMLGGRDNGVEG
jgi:hypothetical protein